jgi:hypothetical protein
MKLRVLPFALAAGWLAVLPALAQPSVKSHARPTADKPTVARSREASAQAPPVEQDPSRLPAPVAAMRAKIMAAAESGDLEELRVAAERNELPPLFTKSQKGDPIAGLKARSGDGEGRETLAILLDVLSAPYVRSNPGTSREMFVWPWFAEYPPASLNGEQLVEVYRVLRAAEFKPSLEKGKYIGWRLAIGPDGTWHYFLTGE